MEIADRIFPIVLSDARVYEELARLDYVEFWSARRSQLNDKLKSLTDLSHTARGQDTLNLYDDIRRIIDNFTDLIRDMNTLTPDMHRDEDFCSLVEALDRKIVEDNLENED